MKKNINTDVYTKNGEEFIFSFYTNLRATDKISFVNSVVNTVVDENSYNSVIRDLIFDYMIVTTMTDIDTSNIQNSNNSINMIEDLLEETNIVEIVKVNAEDGLIDELNRAIDDAIAYKTGIRKNPIAESLGHLLNTIEKKLSGIDTDEMMKAAQMITQMTGELTPQNMIDTYAKSDVFKQKYEKLFKESDSK